MDNIKWGLERNGAMVTLEKQGERIKRARKFKLWSQTDLSEKMAAELGEPFDDGKLSRIENGKQDVSSRELYALSLLLEQPVPWLQGVEDGGFDAKGVSRSSNGLVPAIAA